jgi:hypothetical protein
MSFEEPLFNYRLQMMWRKDGKTVFYSLATMDGFAIEEAAKCQKKTKGNGAWKVIDTLLRFLCICSFAQHFTHLQAANEFY